MFANATTIFAAAAVAAAAIRSPRWLQSRAGFHVVSPRHSIHNNLNNQQPERIATGRMRRAQKLQISGEQYKTKKKNNNNNNNQKRIRYK